MNKYSVYIKDRAEPILVEADTVAWHFKDSLGHPLPMKSIRFKAAGLEVAAILSDQLQGYTIERQKLLPKK